MPAALPAGNAQAEARPYAGFLIRAVAHLLDVFIFTILMLVTLLVIGATTLGSDGVIRDPALPPLLVVLLAPVLTILLWATVGATPGKLICGLRIVDAVNGGRIGLLHALARYVGYAISWISVLGFLWIALDPKKRGWHDLIARTVVVRGPARP